MSALANAVTQVAADRFGQCISFTWRPENDGQPYHVTPGDHGGPTAWGVTFAAFAAWRLAHRAPRPNLADLRMAQKNEFSTLIRTSYWNAVQADHLPAGVDLLTYEFGFGSGPVTSVQQLQRALNQLGADVVVDGALGAQTLEAANQAVRHDLIERLGAAHAAFYGSLGQPVFLRGWLRRSADRLALAMAS